jgi:hypothetical protein
LKRRTRVINKTLKKVETLPDETAGQKLLDDILIDDVLIDTPDEEF